MRFEEFNMDNVVTSSPLRAIVVECAEVYIQDSDSVFVPDQGIYQSNIDNAILTSEIKLKNLQLISGDGYEVSQYPVILFNVIGLSIGTAHSKDEVLTLWNNDNSNMIVGTLYGGDNPYSFKVDLNPNEILDKVVANPLAEFSDSDLVAMADNNNETILFR